MQTAVLNYAKSSLYRPIAAGVVWGIFEFIFGSVLKPYLPAGTMGSVLAGASVFFLASGLASEKHFLNAAILFFAAAFVKILPAVYYNVPIVQACTSGPVLAMCIQASVYYVFMLLFSAKKEKSVLLQFISGAAITSVAAVLYPVLQIALGQTLCMKSGSNIPMSVYYLHYTAIVGALAFPAALSLNKRSERG